MSQVHQVLQAAYGWEDAHLARFTPDDPFAPLRPVDGAIPDVLQWWRPGQKCEEPGDRAEEDCSLPRSGSAFYEYDFGDGWLHRLPNEDTPPARLIYGARRGPLEDSGIFTGYEEIMDALTDPTTPNAPPGWPK